MVYHWPSYNGKRQMPCSVQQIHVVNVYSFFCFVLRLVFVAPWRLAYVVVSSAWLTNTRSWGLEKNSKSTVSRSGELVQGSHGSGKSQGKTIFLQGQGKVREFWFESGNIFFYVKSVKSQGILYQDFVITNSSCWENNNLRDSCKLTLGKPAQLPQTMWEVQLYTH